MTKKRLVLFSLAFAVALLAAVSTASDEAAIVSEIADAQTLSLGETMPNLTLGDAVVPVPTGWHLTPPMTDEGGLTGVAMDAEYDTPLIGAEVKIMFLDGSPVDTQTSDSTGKFTFADLTDADYKITLAYPGYITTDMWTGVIMDQTTQLPPGIMVREPVILHGDVDGVLTDALSGNPIPQVNVDFRWGINPPDTDPVLYSTTTNFLGRYFVQDMRAGVYTAFGNKDGYQEGTFTVFAQGTRFISNQNGVMSPELFGEELRIVLTWGAIPSDLDSHLWAPHHGCAAQNPFHLYYSTRGSHGCTAYFDLDLDDVTSYGPETTTIYQSSAAGTYRFLVQDYTNRSCTGGFCMTMSNSGATVTILTATDTYIYYITPNTSATVWRVFEVDGATQAITFLDQFDFISTPSAVY